jgi:hypothetical protein
MEQLLEKVKPYIHYELGFIVSNPLEDDINEIKPINLRQIASILDVTYGELKNNIIPNSTINGEYVFAMYEVGFSKTVQVNGRVLGKQRSGFII